MRNQRLVLQQSSTTHTFTATVPQDILSGHFYQDKHFNSHPPRLVPKGHATYLALNVAMNASLFLAIYMYSSLSLLAEQINDAGTNMHAERSAANHLPVHDLCLQQ